MARSKIFVFGGIGLAILAVIIFFSGKKPASPPPATLQFWGFGDSPRIWEGIFADFQKDNPHITLQYRDFEPDTYEDTLVNRMAEGQGPDIFLLSSASVLKHRDKILPLPQNVFKIAPKDFRGAFVDIAADDLITEKGEILGFPLFIDTLALFYDKDKFNASGIARAPMTWNDTLEAAKKLTEINAAGDIVKSGIALGSSENIEHFFEIASALMLQFGDEIANRQTHDAVLGQEAADALRFYTSFADPARSNYSWSNRFKTSLNSFSDGTSAMMLGFAEDVPRIMARNRHLDLGIAPLPQPQDASVKISYGKYLFATVAKSSKNSSAAWQFLTYLASHDGSKAYISATNRAPARRDLIGEGTDSETLDVFYRQALIAKDWPVPDPVKTETFFQSAIGSINTKTLSPETAITRLREQIQLLLPRS